MTTTKTAITPVVHLPVMGVCRNPLLGLRPSDMREVELLATLEQLAPPAQGLLIVRRNGEWILTDDWPLVQAMPGDVIEWFDMPADKDTLRSVLMIVIVVFAIWNPLGWSALAMGAFQIGAGLAVSLLLPPTTPGQNAGRQSAALFSASLQGNQAALDQPVWKTFGRRRITPPFACQPYLEFIPKDDPDETGDTSDQYFYALFAIGEGDYVVERELIGDTQITNFSDVTVHAYLPPGAQPSVVLANVTTAMEVSNLSLDSERYVGGFAGCAPRRTVRAIGIDVIAVRGLGKGTDELTVAWQIETRPINDFGVPQADWEVLASETRTAATNTPQRWSSKYAIATPYRPEVRLVRTDVKDTDAIALHEIAWVSLRAYLAQPAPLNPNVAHYEVVMRASEQLSAQTQNQFSVIVRGMVRTWAPVVGWGPRIDSRNGAWHVLEIASNLVMGLAYADDQIDLQSFYDISQVATARQDRSDYTFTSSMDAWGAMQLIARTLRARVFRRNGKVSIARDEWQSLPVTAFTPRNTQPDSMVLHEQLPTDQAFDGVILEYEDLRTWKWTPVECPCPGVVAMQRPLRKRIEGITGSIHAHREGVFEAASMVWRRTTVSCVTELQGMLPAYMDLVRWMPELRGYGQSGDVCFWDAGTRQMGLSEPIAWGALPNYLTLLRDDGTPTLPVAVMAGATAYDVILPAAPDFALVLDDGTRERPKFLIGPLATCDEIVKIAAIGDGGESDDGARLIAIDAVVDDKRVHDADAYLLPGPGDIQDPVDTTYIDGEGGNAVIVRLKDHVIVAGDSVSLNQGISASITLHNDGSATWQTFGVLFPEVPVDGSFPNEWLNRIVETTETALFEVRVKRVLTPGYWIQGTVGRGPSGPPAPVGPDLLDTWLRLDVDRTWGIVAFDPGNADYATSVRLQFEVRRVGSAVVLCTREIWLVVIYEAGTGTGDGDDGGDGDGGGGD